MQKPEDETAKKEWDSMVGINGIQWDSMGFDGIRDASTEIGLANACAKFIGPAKGIVTFDPRSPSPPQTQTAGGKCPLYIILRRDAVIGGTPAALALVF